VSEVEQIWRDEWGRVLALLVAQYRRLDLAEDALADAFLAATRTWPRDGVPSNPPAWLLTAARRRVVDRLRAEAMAVRKHPLLVVEADVTQRAHAVLADPGGLVPDERLRLLLLCAHPALSTEAASALSLRLVLGVSTEDIARLFLTTTSTMAARITRAKRKLVTAGVPLAVPDDSVLADRVGVVASVAYLAFTAGYAPGSGPDPLRADLAADGIRLARVAHELLPDRPRLQALLALMLLTDARRPARTGADGALVPLDEQDRTTWDSELIDEGVDLISDVLARGPIGPYQLQAAIAAIHAEAKTADATDWKQILALYTLLEQVAPNPMVTLNRAVAAAMVDGPAAGLALLEVLERDQRMARHHRLHAVRAHLLELGGDRQAAHASFTIAARLTTSLPEQRYLNARAQELGGRG